MSVGEGSGVWVSVGEGTGADVSVGEGDGDVVSVVVGERDGVVSANATFEPMNEAIWKTTTRTIRRRSDGGSSFLEPNPTL